jgi:broad specificity phosphatase PhoE
VEIVLARHGRPLVNDIAPIAGAELGRWVRHYDRCGIDRGTAPPDTLRRLAAAAGCVLSSDLPRSIESAAWLSDRAETHPELHEAALPDRIRISIRMHSGVCVALARVMWWLNLGRSAETIADTRQRANRVADRLCLLAAEHQSMLVIGHGMFNRFVAACLRRRGWRGPKMLPRDYWSTARFAKNP